MGTSNDEIDKRNAIKRLEASVQNCIVAFRVFGISAQEFVQNASPVMQEMAEVWREVYPPNQSER